jgi:D-sedoheptulose 7-phosphate isomerase
MWQRIRALLPDALIRTRIEESIAAKRALLDDPAQLAAVARIAEVLADAFRAGGRVLLCGNGGSAADATHVAAELVGRFQRDRAPLDALSLSDNPSALTAIANDYAYDEVFARQVRGLGRAGDVLVAMSTSGTSPNIVNAVAAARETGLTTVAMTGTRGAAFAASCDVALTVPVENTARVQEVTMLAVHTVCELVESALFA